MADSFRCNELDSGTSDSGNKGRVTEPNIFSCRIYDTSYYSWNFFSSDSCLEM